MHFVTTIAVVACVLLAAVLGYANGLFMSHLDHGIHVCLSVGASLALCAGPWLLVRLPRAARAALALAALAAIGVGLGASDCGTGSGGAAELCLMEPCEVTLTKIRESIPDIPERSVSMVARAVIALRCADWRALRP